MWKIISLSALLIVAQAAEIHDFYGDWIQVALYPSPGSNHGSVCTHFSFAKSTENEQCTYADGRNATLVQTTISPETGKFMGRFQLAVRVVDTLAEVMPALNISVKCGDRVISAGGRSVVRLVNEDYFIMYGDIHAILGPEFTHYENVAQLFGKNVVSSSQLNNVTTNIEDLKNRQGLQMCGIDNNGGSKNTEN